MSLKQTKWWWITSLWSCFSFVYSVLLFSPVYPVCFMSFCLIPIKDWLIDNIFYCLALTCWWPASLQTTKFNTCSSVVRSWGFVVYCRDLAINTQDRLFVLAFSLLNPFAYFQLGLYWHDLVYSVYLDFWQNCKITIWWYHLGERVSNFTESSFELLDFTLDEIACDLTLWLI